jgi:hypothetical protein
MATRQPARFALLRETDEDLEPAIPKIQCVRVPLRAESYDAANFAAQRCQPYLGVAIDSRSHVCQDWPMLRSAPNRNF